MFEIIFFSFVIFSMIRVSLVCAAGLKHCDAVFQHNIKAIEEDFPNYPKNKKKYGNVLDEYLYGTYDLRKWTYKQFYPND